MQRSDPVIVIGASAAGLATAASLAQRGIDHVLLEQHDHVAHAWRNHYERLHLHTAKGASHLPGLRFPPDTPRYATRDQVVAYLEAYCDHFELKPRFGHRVTAIVRDETSWIVHSDRGDFRAAEVVLATGNTRVPHIPKWPGMDHFEGTLLHSSEYRTGAQFKGQRVLVVGFGNSGCEIAIDLHEQGAIPSLAVRSPVNVIPRDILGVPILSIGIALSAFSPKVADVLGAPLMRLVIGDIEQLGLHKLPYGPIQQITEHGRIPLLDIGTMKLIREEKIQVRPGLQAFEGSDVVFEGGAREPYDGVVLATGYDAKLRDFLGELETSVDLSAKSIPSGDEIAPGLYLCGFYVSPTGMLREISREAQKIADRIRQRRSSQSSE